MNKVQVSHTGIHQRLEGSQSYPLYNPSPQQALVICSSSPTPRTADNNEDRSQQVEMPLSPHSSRGHEEEACHSNTTQMISRQEGHGREVSFEYD